MTAISLHRWACLAGLQLFLALSGSSDAQILQTGQHFYAVKNLETGLIEQRGEAGSNGIAFADLALGPETSYSIRILQAATLHVGEHRLFTPAAGQEVALPAIIIRPSLAPDRDGDGLHDQAEEIVGTNPAVKDTDGDGVDDGPEIAAGTDPLDGVPARTGIIGTTDTPGTAVDLCAAADMAVVADTNGVMVFNIFNGMEPIIVAQVNTSGTAKAVACAGLRFPVAIGAGGVAIIDASDPPNAVVAHQTYVGGLACAVASDGISAFVGNEQGELHVVDLASGVRFHRQRVGSDPIEDLVISGDHLHVLSEKTLALFDIVGRTPNPVGALALTLTHDAASRMRLAVFDGIAYVVYNRGYDTIDVRNPRQPRLILHSTTAQFGWRHLALNGGGIGVAVVGTNGAPSADDHVSTYNTSDPAVNDAFLTQFTTPGTAAAVALYNGFGYVADGAAGLQVINFLAADTGDTPPQITLAHNLFNNTVSEGERFRVTAEVTDDVQVRNVEFFLDGARVGIDGNAPFELFLQAPAIGDRASFALSAQATDTGGNVADASDILVSLTADTMPPEIAGSDPPNGGIAGQVSAFQVVFFEDIDPATATTAAFSLTHLGGDGIQGTGDDAAVAIVSTSYDAANRAVTVELGGNVSAGYFAATVQGPLADTAGNALPAPRTIRFHSLGLDDADGDGIPDANEAALGLDPARADSDGNGIPDGEEDFDSDALRNAAELALGTLPGNNDSDGDGTLDGAEDREGDGLSDSGEFYFGTSPFESDTDGDGWLDAVEAGIGTSSGNDSQSVPRLLLPNRSMTATTLLGAPDRLLVPVASKTSVSVLGIPAFGKKAGVAVGDPVITNFQ